MKEIKLTQGMVALVDDEDFLLLSKYSWFVKDNKNGFYARRNTPGYTNRKVMMHREILGITDPGIHVDHIDRNGLNNQRSNLRLCDKSLNMANRRKNTKGSSRFKGVRKNTNGHGLPWRACVANKHIGYYESEIEAALAYNVAASFQYREFARLNKI